MSNGAMNKPELILLHLNILLMISMEINYLVSTAKMLLLSCHLLYYNSNYGLMGKGNSLLLRFHILLSSKTYGVMHKLNLTQPCLHPLLNLKIYSAITKSDLTLL